MKVKQTGTGTLIHALSGLYKMVRLETDQSTENVTQKVEVVCNAARMKIDRLLADADE